MEKMSNERYSEYIDRISPKSKLFSNTLKAFAGGGAICAVGQLLLAFYGAAGLNEENAATAASITLVFAGILLTALGLYARLAKICGAGTLVPITGFANAVASPAIEFKTEGTITGTCVKMFTIAGPVIVCGVTAGALYGLVYAIFAL